MCQGAAEPDTSSREPGLWIAPASDARGHAAVRAPVTPRAAEPAAAPFTTADAHVHGISATALRSPQYRRLFSGVYVCTGVPLDCSTWVRAARLVLPGDATVTSLSGLHLRGVTSGRLGLCGS
jgi:hypothetical protein